MSEASYNLDQYQGLDEELLVDTLEGKRTYLLVGKKGTQVRLSSSAYQLVKAVRDGTSFHRLAQMVNEQRAGEKVSPAQLEEAYHGVMGKLAQIEERASDDILPGGFWLRWRIFPQGLVQKVSSFLSIFFHPYLAPVFLLIIALGIAGAFWGGMSLELNEASFVPAYLLFLGSLIIHEFGHSSACARYGAEPSDIGFTVYLIYPAFYSDVSSAWRLSRWQRVMVDLGGSYFQFVVGAVFVAAFFLSGWDPLRLAFLMILYGSLFSLNPIFKFDGYWVVADALGVTNLGQQPGRIARHFVDRVRRREAEPLPWPLAITATLVVYSVGTVLVWGVFLIKLLPTVWTRLLEYPKLILTLMSQLVGGLVPTWPDLRTLLVSTFLLLISLLMLWRFAKPLLLLGAKHLPLGRKSLDSSQDQPLTR